MGGIPNSSGSWTVFFPMISKIGDAFGSMLPNEIDVSGLPEGEWTARAYTEWNSRSHTEGGTGAGSCRSVSIRRTCHSGEGRRSVYLDLETTGLSGSRGAYAFLVGLGFNEEESFRVVQLFMAGPAWEKNWLKALGSELPEDDYGLVTFNGRSFDLPILRIRHRIAKSAPRWEGRPHMDLLMLARHFYRGRLPSCSLSTVERMVLGVHRSGEDVPGREIPRIYTNFLASLDASPRRGVFYHNVLDVISMAALQVHIGSLAEMDEGNERERYDKVRRPLGRGGDARDLKESVDEGP